MCAERPLVAAAIESVRTFLRETGYPPGRLARRAGLSKENGRAIWLPDWNPRARTLEALEVEVQRVRKTLKPESP